MGKSLCFCVCVLWVELNLEHPLKCVRKACVSMRVSKCGAKDEEE